MPDTEPPPPTLSPDASETRGSGMPLAVRRQERLPFLHLLPNLVTIIGLCAGLTSMRFTLTGQFDIAAALIIFAALVDGIDGLLARRLKAASSFGAELDSLSDFVCFGVAPAVLVYQFALNEWPGLGWIFALVFAICCCLRLARFNVSRSAPPPPGRAHFVGVPAPAGAMMALLPVFVTLEGLLDLTQLPVLVAVYIGGVGLLMVSRIPTLSPKGIRITRGKAPFVLVGVAAAVGMAFTRFWLLMVIAVLAYVVLVAHGILTARRRPTL